MKLQSRTCKVYLCEVIELRLESEARKIELLTSDVMSPSDRHTDPSCEGTQLTQIANKNM